MDLICIYEEMMQKYLTSYKNKESFQKFIWKTFSCKFANNVLNTLLIKNKTDHCFKQVMHIMSMLLEMKVNVKITSKPFINLVTKEEHKQIYHKQP